MRALIYNQQVEFKNDIPIKNLTGEALIKVTLAGICNTDVELIKGYMGFTGILGHEFVGIVEKASNKSLMGKRVCGEINCPCGKCYFCENDMSTHCPNRSVLGIFKREGCFADYLSLPEENLFIIPDEISDEEAVFVEPIAAAFEILEQIKINKKDRIVVLGDGKLGLLIAQVLANYTDNLTAVGKHIKKLEILKNRGIKTLPVIDVKNLTADIVVEATGSSDGINMALNIVRPRGTIILKTTVAGNQNVNLSKVVVDEISMIGSRCGPFAPAILALAEKKIDVKPLIDKTFDFNQAKEAIEYASQKGTMKVLLRM